jgi:hypothetical protein
MENSKTLADFHKEQAIACFNKTWDLIDLNERTEQDTLNMIHCAHASRYHWGEVGAPLHWERGEWQISKVYSLAGNGESALYHAKACLSICETENITDFDITFAYEAMAKAYKLLGITEQFEYYKSLAYKSLDNIVEQNNKDYALAELNKL